MAVEASDIYQSACTAIRALAPRFAGGGDDPNTAVAAAISRLEDSEIPRGIPMFLPPPAPPRDVAAYLLKSATMQLREVAKFIDKAGHDDLADAIVASAAGLERALAPG